MNLFMIIFTRHSMHNVINMPCYKYVHVICACLNRQTPVWWHARDHTGLHSACAPHHQNTRGQSNSASALLLIYQTPSPPHPHHRNGTIELKSVFTYLIQYYVMAWVFDCKTIVTKYWIKLVFYLQVLQSPTVTEKRIFYIWQSVVQFNLICQILLYAEALTTFILYYGTSQVISYDNCRFWFHSLLIIVKPHLVDWAMCLTMASIFHSSAARAHKMTSLPTSGWLQQA